MTKNPARRLGCSGNESQIRTHAFFKDLDWEALELRKVKPPFRPRVVRISNVELSFNSFAQFDFNQSPLLMPLFSVRITEKS